MSVSDRSALIAQYEELRKRLKQMQIEAEKLDKELEQLERELPDDYEYPGDQKA